MAKDNETAGTAAITVPVNNRKKYLLFGLAALVLVAVSVGITLLVVTPGMSSPTVPEEVAAADEVKKPALYYSLKPAFVVNFATQGRQRFLQTDVSLLIRDADISAALDLHMPAIRNSLVLLFSAQQFDALQTIEGKEMLREEALASVQGVLLKEIGKPGVEQVLFTSFVMQ